MTEGAIETTPITEMTGWIQNLSNLPSAAQLIYRNETLETLLAVEVEDASLFDLTLEQRFRIEIQTTQEVIRKTADYIFDAGEKGRDPIIAAAQECLTTPQAIQEQTSRLAEGLGAKYSYPPELAVEYLAMLSRFHPAQMWLAKNPLSTDYSHITQGQENAFFLVQVTNQIKRRLAEEIKTLNPDEDRVISPFLFWDKVVLPHLDLRAKELVDKATQIQRQKTKQAENAKLQFIADDWVRKVNAIAQSKPADTDWDRLIRAVMATNKSANEMFGLENGQALESLKTILYYQESQRETIESAFSLLRKAKPLLWLKATRLLGPHLGCYLGAEGMRYQEGKVPDFYQEIAVSGKEKYHALSVHQGGESTVSVFALRESDGELVVIKTWPPEKHLLRKESEPVRNLVSLARKMTSLSPDEEVCLYGPIMPFYLGTHYHQWFAPYKEIGMGIIGTGNKLQLYPFSLESGWNPEDARLLALQNDEKLTPYVTVGWVPKAYGINPHIETNVWPYAQKVITQIEKETGVALIDAEAQLVGGSPSDDEQVGKMLEQGEASKVEMITKQHFLFLDTSLARPKSTTAREAVEDLTRRFWQILR